MQRAGVTFGEHDLVGRQQSGRRPARSKPRAAVTPAGPSTGAMNGM